MRVLHLLKIYLLPSFIKLLLLKKNGNIGKNFKIGIGSWIFSDDLMIGDNVTIGNNTVIKTKKLTLGKNIKIGSRNNIEAHQYIKIGNNCKISEQNIIGGTQTFQSSIDIGNDVHIYPFCFINTSLPVVFEDGVGIGGGTYIFTHGSWQDAYEGFPYSYAPVTIKKNAWLPWRVFVMPGVTIGEEATIGSSALVGKDIPDRSFAVGMPAKVIKQGNDYIKVMDEENKLKLMNEIFSSFVKQIKEFNNINSKLETRSNSVEIICEDNHTIIYTLNNNYKLDIDKYTIITELDNTNNFSIPQRYIDMKSKKYSILTNKVDFLLIDYLTNFGIRLHKC